MEHPNNFIKRLSIQNTLDNLPGGMFVYRATGNEELLYANQKMVELFECDSMEDFIKYIDNSFKKLVYAEDLKSSELAIWAQINAGNNHFDHIKYRIKTKKGAIRYIEDFGHYVNHSEEGPLFFVFVVDESMKNRTYDIDSLTQLCGKQRFMEYTGHMMELARIDSSAARLCVIDFNVQHFKTLNLMFGGSAGDEYLKKLSTVLLKNYPNGFISRFGGDNFMVLTEYENAIEKAKAVQKELEPLYPELSLKLLAGIYPFAESATSAAKACDLARVARNNAKYCGEPYCIFDDKLGSAMELRHYVTKSLDKALENGHIKVYYQPIIRTISKKLCGLEALARWQDPERGLLSPFAFISVLEETRQIHKLDSYIIREICRNYRMQIDAGKPAIPVSFNLSRQDFLSCDIFQVVLDATREYHVPHNMVHVEITESLFVKDAAHIAKEIEKFHKDGFQVWMDDFGSEYSSLNVLKDYKFDELKVDMVFLSDFSETSKNIITSMVDMAKKIGLQTLAEGVETEEHCNFLHSIGCDKIQGYLFGKPLPYDECMEHCKKCGLEIETTESRSYYNAINKLNVITNIPLSIIEYDGKKYHYLYANPAYMNILRSMNTDSLEKSERNINSKFSMRAYRIRNFMRKVAASDKEEMLIYSVDSNYRKSVAKKIASHNNRTAFTVSLFNVSKDVDKKKKDLLAETLGNLTLLYDDIRLVKLDEDMEEILLSSVASADQLQKPFWGIQKTNYEVSKAFIHPEDAERYLRFTDSTDLWQRIKQNHRGILSQIFRYKCLDGVFRKKECTILALPSERHAVLVCIKEVIE